MLYRLPNANVLEVGMLDIHPHPCPSQGWPTEKHAVLGSLRFQPRHRRDADLGKIDLARFICEFGRVLILDSNERDASESWLRSLPNRIGAENKPLLRYPFFHGVRSTAGGNFGCVG